MKKMLALILALMMAVCMFSACSKDEGKKVDTANPESVVEAFLDRVMAGDKAALDYVEEGSEGYDAASEAIKAKEYIIEEMVEYIGAPVDYAERVEELVKELAEKAFAKAEYEVLSVEIDGDKAVAEIVTIAPSPYTVMDSFNEVDAQAILENHPEILETMNEDEDAGTFEFMKYVFEATTESENICEEADATVQLEKKDGKWVITSID